MAFRRLIIIIYCCVVGLVLSQDESTRGPQSPIDQVFAPPPPSGCRAGFTVRKAETRNLLRRQKLRFQDVLTNTGGWSQSSSDFRAPCSGVYYFSFHAVSVQRGDFTLALMKNNVYQVTAYGSDDDYQQGSNSALLVLRRGDRVHLELQDGKIYEHPFNEAYTTFSGFLVERF
ncbi:Complement C1q-like protein 4 [Halocaridina rubra]|uniref:Complement C1q-like protein 4 n=1 Tax=Halocaridina rubra TaxID=373956 RepID=A0AAN8XT73_HALRR